MNAIEIKGLEKRYDGFQLGSFFDLAQHFLNKGLPGKAHVHRHDGQDVQALELVAGVADGAADGGIRPVGVRVAVEPQVQFDEPRDGLHVVADGYSWVAKKISR